MTHANAKLTVYGRRTVLERVQRGWTQAQVAEAMGVSRSTVAKWWKLLPGRGRCGAGGSVQPGQALTARPG